MLKNHFIENPKDIYNIHQWTILFPPTEDCRKASLPSGDIPGDEFIYQGRFYIPRGEFIHQGRVCIPGKSLYTSGGGGWGGVPSHHHLRTVPAHSALTLVYDLLPRPHIPASPTDPCPTTRPSHPYTLIPAPCPGPGAGAGPLRQVRCEVLTSSWETQEPKV